MSNLRDLLMDCRMELRKRSPDFQGTTLQKRVDTAITALANLSDATILGMTKTVSAGDAQNAQRVAAAWQAAANSIRATQPDVYEALSKSVMARVGSMAMTNQANEATALEAIASAKATAEMPVLNLPPIPPSTSAAAASAAAKPQTPAPTVLSDAEDTVPTEEILRAVAAGARKLRSDQLEWCIGEAVVLSEFQASPLDLIAKGDMEIARLILASRNEA